MENPLSLRPAAPEDAPHAAELIASTMGTVGEAMFGAGNHVRTVEALSEFFRLSGHRLSYQFTTLAVWEGQTAGLLLSFPGGDMERLEKSLYRPFLRFYGGLWGVLKFLWRATPDFYIHEAEADEYFIAHLATAPGFQRRGIGRALLNRAEQMALDSGLLKCSLLVEAENEPAKHLYSQMGFQMVQAIHTRWMERRYGMWGYQRRVKNLKGE